MKISLHEIFSYEIFSTRIFSNLWYYPHPLSQIQKQLILILRAPHMQVIWMFNVTNLLGEVLIQPHNVIVIVAKL